MSKPPKERFWEKVDKTGGCWEWLGCAMHGGYGGFWSGKRLVSAHRYVWEITNGPIPEGMFVCHHCDNPSCVKPSHLFVGTTTDNMIDMTSKGRGKPYHPKGVNNGHSKLTPDNIREIRRIYVEDNASQAAIGRMFGVVPTTIHNVIHRKKWAHIKEGG